MTHKNSLPSSLLNRLQKVQNNAARLVLHERKSDHVTALLTQFLSGSLLKPTSTTKLPHLLSGTLRILLLPTFPNCFKSYQPTWTLRSSNEKLKIPKTNLKSAGSRSFWYEAAAVWNTLPIAVCNFLSLSLFQTNLRNQLFEKHFTPGYYTPPVSSLNCMIFNLRILCEKYLQHQQDLYHALIDFKKAFDRIWNAALWATMKEYNISTNLIQVIKNLSL